MSTALLEAPHHEASRGLEVEVSDLIGQQRVRFNNVAPETPIEDLLGLSKTKLSLPPVVDWWLRDNASARLLRNDEVVGDVAREGKVDLTLQPDVRLG